MTGPRTGSDFDDLADDYREVSEYDPYHAQRLEEHRVAKLARQKDKLRKVAGKGPSRAKALREPHTSIAKVESDRSRKNSRVKGSAFELKIAKLWSQWSGEHIRRTPQSGGWSNARFGVTGDLVCDNKKWPFHIECFAGDTLVLTFDGYRPISEIKVGDKVMAHKGRWRKVTHIHTRVGDTMSFTHGASTLPIWMTEEHPIEAFDGRWYHAVSATHTSHLTKFANAVVIEREKLATAKPPREVVSNTMCACGCGMKLLKTDDRSRPRRFISGHNGGLSLRTPLPSHVPLDADLCYLIGLYIAEGHCSKDKVVWTFHRDETLLHSAVASIVKGKFSVDTTRQFSKKTKACAVYACSTTLADTFKAWCGTGSRVKRLGWMVGLDDVRARALLRGLFQGDGHIDLNNASYWTMSRALAFDVQALLLRLGITSYVGRNAKGLYKVNVARPCLDSLGEQLKLVTYTPNTDASYERSFVQDLPDRHRIYFRDPEVHGYKRCRIYNLTVDQDETYVVQGNLVVHNCKKREGWFLDDLITGVRPDDSRSLRAWWKQTVESCPERKYAVLVFARNNRTTLLMMWQDDWREILMSKHNQVPRKYVPHFTAPMCAAPNTPLEGAVIIMALTEFFENVSSKTCRRSP